ncbi:M48 family metallopeptidase [Candidatus Micrarchaeota archaeon]|nr:M48 family metallopeptidase [Candidatus Micrarchaeota archaeon]
MLKEAFLEIFPEKPVPTFNQIVYSSRIRFYNAYASLRNSEITIKLSKNYENVNRSVVIGVLQSLLSRIYRKKIVTQRMREAGIFLEQQRKEYRPRIKNETPQELKESFQRINLEYFDNLLQMPLLNWGRDSYRRLGQYVGTFNLIRISRRLEKSPPYVLDYIMYHEMLHLQRDRNRKKHAKVHTKEFNTLEESFKLVKDAKRWIKENLSRRRYF